MKQCKVGMDQENIISTFASTQFYGDPDAYIREFLQNAIDACNTRAALEWSLGNRVSGDGGGKSLKFHAKSVFSSNFHSV